MRWVGRSREEEQGGGAGRRSREEDDSTGRVCAQELQFKVKRFSSPTPTPFCHSHSSQVREGDP